MGLVTHVLYDRPVWHFLPTATCPRRPNPSLFLIGVESGIAARSAPLRDQKSLWPIACSSSIKSKQLPQSAPAGNWRYQAIRLAAIVSRSWRPPTRFCVGRSSSSCWQYTSVTMYSDTIAGRARDGGSFESHRRFPIRRRPTSRCIRKFSVRI